MNEFKPFKLEIIKMAKCYAQFTHPSFAPAYPDQYDVYGSLAECKSEFEGNDSNRAVFDGYDSETQYALAREALDDGLIQYEVKRGK